MYLARVTRYDTLYGVNQLSRAMLEPSKAHMGAAKYALHYLAGTINIDITHKKGGFALTTFSNAS